MEIEDRITNTGLVVGAGRERAYSDMIPRLARKYPVDAEVLWGVHSKVWHLITYATEGSSYWIGLV